MTNTANSHPSMSENASAGQYIVMKANESWQKFESAEKWQWKRVATKTSMAWRYSIAE